MLHGSSSFFCLSHLLPFGEKERTAHLARRIPIRRRESGGLNRRRRVVVPAVAGISRPVNFSWRSETRHESRQRRERKIARKRTALLARRKPHTARQRPVTAGQRRGTPNKLRRVSPSRFIPLGKKTRDSSHVMKSVSLFFDNSSKMTHRAERTVFLGLIGPFEVLGWRN